MKAEEDCHSGQMPKVSHIVSGLRTDHEHHFDNSGVLQKRETTVMML